MNKDYKVYLHHMLDAIATIEDYARNLTQGRFLKAKLVQDGVIRNLRSSARPPSKFPKVSAAGIRRLAGGISPGCGMC